MKKFLSVAVLVAVAWSAFQLYTAAFGLLHVLMQRAVVCWSSEKGSGKSGQSPLSFRGASGRRAAEQMMKPMRGAPRERAPATSVCWR